MIRSVITALVAAAALLLLPALAGAEPLVLDGTGQLDPDATVYQYENGVISPDGAFAYYGRGPNNGQAKIIKVRLSDLTRVDTLMLSATNSDGETQQQNAAAIDATGTYAYFGSNYNTNPRLLKIRLSDFTVASRVIAVNTGANSGGINKVLLSPDGATAYTLMNNGWVLKINTSTMAVTGQMDIRVDPTKMGTVPRGVLSPDGATLYLTGNASNEPLVVRVMKVRTSDLTNLGVTDFPAAGTYTESRSLSPDGAYLYLGVTSTPRQILKVRVSDMSVVGTATLPNDITHLMTSAIAPNGSELYVATRPSKVFSVDTATMTAGDPLVLATNATFCPSGPTGWYCPPFQMLPSPSGEFLYTTNTSNTILRLRVPTPAPSNGGGSGGGQPSSDPAPDSGSGSTPVQQSDGGASAPVTASTPIASTPVATLRVPQTQLQGGNVQQQVTTSGPGRVTVIVTRNGKLVCRTTQKVRGAVKVSIGCAAPAKGTKSTLSVLTAFVPTTGKGVVQKNSITQGAG